MQKVILTQGLPASGKSTWAKNHVLTNPNWKRINRDDLRRMIDVGKYSKENEKLIRKIRDTLLFDFLVNGFSVIIDDTNFEQSQIDNIRSIAISEKVPVEVRYFNADPVECVKRNALRDEWERVPEEVIWQMYEKYVKPNEYKENEKLVQDPNLPRAIIVDLDGTLAIHNGRSPYACEKAGEDRLNHAVAKAVFLWYHTKNKDDVLFFMSGRNERCREVTLQWIIHNLQWLGFGDNVLLMRADGDNRKDSIVKKEIFNNHIRDKYFVDFVFDDRDQVVDMWRNTLGLPCFQVNCGNF